MCTPYHLEVLEVRYLPLEGYLPQRVQGDLHACIRHVTLLWRVSPCMYWYPAICTSGGGCGPPTGGPPNEVILGYPPRMCTFWGAPQMRSFGVVARITTFGGVRSQGLETLDLVLDPSIW